MSSVIHQLKPQEHAYTFGHGLFKKNEQFHWNPDEEDNPHLLVWGSSGSGKSFLLREIINYLASRKKHIHLIDQHGDLKTSNDNTMQFGGSQNIFGINPFQFDDKSENAGPKSQIPILVSMFRSTYLPNMGGVQELVLKQLCSDTYLLAGFDKTDPATWMHGQTANNTPSLNDMLKLIHQIIGHLNGPNNVDQYLLNEIKKIRQLAKKNGIGHDLVEKQHAQIMSTISNYIKSEYDKDIDRENLLLNKEIDPRIDLSIYGTKKALSTLETLAMYTSALIQCGIFHSTPPPVRSGVVNRYQLQYVDDEIRRFFVEALVYKIFRAAQIRGDYQKRGQFARGKKVDSYIILDEVQSILPINSAERNLPSQTYNRIAGEARKYGLGLIVITQSPGTYPTPMLTNIAKRVGLKTNPIDIADAKKNLGVSDIALFNHLQRPFTAIVSNKRGGYDPVDINRG